MEAEIEIPDWARMLVSDHTDMDRSPRPVDSSKVSRFRLELPDDVYYEYAFLDGEGRMRADPLNQVKGRNPWYRELSAIEGPDYLASEYADLPESLSRGVLDRHRVSSEALSDADEWAKGVGANVSRDAGGGRQSAARRVSVYTPAGEEGSKLPLLVVHDGTAFLRLAGLPRVLEKLLEEGRARPARLAFVEPVDRSSEYGFNEAYLDFTREELLPFLEDRYPGSEQRLGLGASLGGLVSATLALRWPAEWSGIATFSGAFLGSPDDRDFYRSEQSWVLERLRALGAVPFGWYAEVGTIEWLTDVNREVHRQLEISGGRHLYRERNAGHNWENWRNGLAHALAFLLPPGS